MTSRKTKGRGKENEVGYLTASAIHSITEPGKYYDQNGLFLRVERSGSKRWVWRGTVNGRRRELGLGGYHLVSLAEARAKALQYKKLAREGIDPSLIVSEVPTFIEVTEKEIKERIPGWKPGGKSEYQWRSTMAKYANPFMGHLPVDQISSRLIRDCINAILPDIPDTAMRVLQRISAVLDSAVTDGYMAQNPALPVVRSFARKPKRSRQPRKFMHHRQVGDALLRVRECDAYPTLRLAYEFAYLTLVRSGTVCGALWSEIDLDARWWHVPAERMKMSNRSHSVWLSDLVILVLKEAERFKDDSGLVFPYKNGKQLDSWQLSKLTRRLELPAVLNSIRKTFRLYLKEIGISWEVGEDCLAHQIKNAAARAYAESDTSVALPGPMRRWSSCIEAQLGMTRSSSQL
ncbi:MAG: integrase arm-type DNA-binding domain-containing protein [bacterium]|nr:integrase arm-type DNA-binding domain-containing protein [Acidimicrobiia bacterium]MCY4650334.1 integrase arm-type DNA-binding domain-containing protein [bacterium]